jgi:PKD repeat protein
MRNLFIFSLFISCIYSCEKTPAAKPTPPLPTIDFTYSPSNPVAPGTVSFLNTSKNATSFLWDFGNNQSSTQASPSVSYTAGGTYDVTLTGTGEGGTSKTTKSITVVGAPLADFTFNPQSVRVPSPVKFTNTSQNAVSYLWSASNGQTSTLKDPTFTFNFQGNQSVSLTVTSQDGQTNKVTKTVTVLAPFTQVAVNSVTILNYPATRSSGSNWDGNDGSIYPDITFCAEFSANGLQIYCLPATLRRDNLKVSDLPHTFVASNGSFFVRTNPSVAFYLSLYDVEDTLPYEYMGTVPVLINNAISSLTPYPTSVTATNGDYNIRLGLTWQ